MSRSYGSVRPKKDRVYSVDDVLVLFSITRNTLTNWAKAGLRPVDTARPQIFRGAELIRYQVDRALANKRNLQPGEFKCLRCKARVVPDIGSVEIDVRRDGDRIARACCPECSGLVVRHLDASTCIAYRVCLETNTSLHSLDEEKGLQPAGVGTNTAKPSVTWLAENERIIHSYQRYCGKYAEQTRDAHLASIRDFEAYLGTASLRLVKPSDAASFRDELARRGKSSSSRSSIRHRASHLAQFFDWLVKQEGYRQMNHSIADYFQLSRKDAAEAIQPRDRAVPPMFELAQVVGAMPSMTLRQRRDRAIVAASCLFGTRANATASIRVGDVVVETRHLRQDATFVRVKNSKSQTTAWFPVGEAFEQILLEWIAEIRKLGLHDEDALFPPDPDLASQGKLAREDRKAIVPWSTEDGVRRAFHRGCKAAEIPYINPHAVRHALAALGREICRSTEEEQAWSHNLGHQSVQITRSYYAKMTDDRRDETFRRFGQRIQIADDKKDLLLAYHEHRLDPYSPAYKEALELDQKRRRQHFETLISDESRRSEKDLPQLRIKPL